ncbi:MAG: carbohydrate-binding protein, partial [Planctomycetes bacterium]|nr:carbohydrate-binding protein [Planctomycetota bacterium]
MPFGRLVKLTREGGAPPFPPEGSLLVFPDGDRLRAIINGAGEKSLETLPNVLGDVATPIALDSMLGFILAPPSEPDAQEALLARVRGEPRSSDVLWLANGDRLTGTFLGLGPQKFKFQREAGPVEIDRSGVVALEFDPAGAAYPRPAGMYLELTFVDGSRLGVAGCRLEQGHLLATTRWGLAIRVPIGELARVHVVGDHLAYLADRTESAAQYVGYIGPHVGRYGRNSSVDGRVLRL